MSDKDARQAWPSIVRSQGCGFSFEELYNMQKQLLAMMEAREFYLEIRSWRDRTERYTRFYSRYHDAMAGLSIDTLADQYRKYRKLKQKKIEIITVNYYHAEGRKYSHPPLKEMLTADASYVPKSGDKVFVRVPALIYRR